jgi:hypothetical protein
MKVIVEKSAIINIIQNTVKGTTVVSVDTVTEPKMNKTGNPFYGRVTKSCTMNGLIGFDYSNSVNNQANREGKEEREVKARAWGILTEDRLFVTHKDEYYLQVKVQSISDTPVFYCDGEMIDKTVLEPFLVKHSGKSSTQADIDKEVIVRDIKMTNVKSIRFAGGEYDIIPDSDKVESGKVRVSTEASPVDA